MRSSDLQQQQLRNEVACLNQALQAKEHVIRYTALVCCCLGGTFFFYYLNLLEEFKKCIYIMSKATQWQHIIVWMKPMTAKQTNTEDLFITLPFKLTEEKTVVIANTSIIIVLFITTGLWRSVWPLGVLQVWHLSDRNWRTSSSSFTVLKPVRHT